MVGRRLRAMVAAVVGVSLVAGAILVWGEGFARGEVIQSDGAAWLLTSDVGRVSRVDGTTGAVTTQLELGEPASWNEDRYEVAQLGAGAVVLDRVKKSVRRVDGVSGTWGSERDLAPKLSSEDSRLLVGEAGVFVVDGGGGGVVGVDLDSGQLTDVEVSGQDVEATLGEGGLLWVLDRRNGQVTGFRGGKRVVDPVETVGRGPADRDLRLTSSDGRPVVVDVTAGEVVPLDPRSGEPGDAAGCGGSGASVLVAGSGDTTGSGVVAAVDPDGNKVWVVDLGGDGDAAGCEIVGIDPDVDGPVPELGQPVVEAGLVFVPDFAGRRVLIIGRDGRIRGDRTFDALSADRFGLLVDSGLVWAEDPSSSALMVFDPRTEEWSNMAKFEVCADGKPCEETARPPDTEPDTEPDDESEPPPEVLSETEVKANCAAAPPGEVQVGETVTLAGAVDAGVEVLGWEWTIADVGARSGEGPTGSVSVSWATPGVKQAAVVASLGAGGSATCDLSVSVIEKGADKAPVPRIDGPVTAVVGDEVTFRDVSLNTGETSRSWTIVDGSSVTDGGSGESVRRAFTTVGPATVRLTLTAGGRPYSLDRSVRVSAKPSKSPTITGVRLNGVTLSDGDEVAAGREVAFEAPATESPTSWSWDLGSESKSSKDVLRNGQVRHTFASSLAGEKLTIKVKATNAVGSGETVSLSVRVAASKPTVAFRNPPPTVERGKSVTFETNASTGVTGYEWKVGASQQQATGSTFTTSFPSTGPQTITVVAVDGAGTKSLPATHTLSVTNKTLPVPANLAGMTEAQARTALAGFNVRLAPTFACNGTAGTVVSWSPAGASLPEGAEIVLTVNSPDARQVPDLVNTTYGTTLYTTRIADAGFVGRVDPTGVVAAPPYNVVTSQSLAKGQWVCGSERLSVTYVVPEPNTVGVERLLHRQAGGQRPG